MTGTGGDDSRRRADLVASWPAIIAVALLAILLSMMTRGANTLSIDRRTTDAVQQLDGQPWQVIAQVGNGLGESTYAVTVAIVILAVAVVRRDPRDIAFLCTLLILRGATTLLKELFNSPRPTRDMAEVLETFDGFGFPSGHAVTSATALGGLGFLLARHFQARAARWCIAALWLLGMAMTGYARIWVGAHWLTDVVGGSLYGIAIVLLAANMSALVVEWIRERQHHRASYDTS